MKFKTDEYLSENNIISWSIRQTHYINQIQIGDEVFIWRSDAGKKGTGGIIARAIVIGRPVPIAISSKYWVNEIDAIEFGIQAY